MKKELLAKYKNGNYYVKLYDDGTKIKYNNLDNFIPEFAESMDITITTKCDGHCSYCFDEDTEVSTPNGKVKIKDLNKDDLVISYNLDTGKQEIKKILATSKRLYKGQMVKLTFDKAIILCTPNHKFWTSNGYKEAKDLTENDELETI